MVATRSCTQIRTHAQKYFIALQKSPHGGGGGREGSSPHDDGAGTPRKGGNNHKLRGKIIKGSRKNKDRSPGHRKKSKLGGGPFKRINGAGGRGIVADFNPSANYGGGRPGYYRKQRGLTGIEVLAQAAETESDYDVVDQSVDYYKHNEGYGKIRKRKNGAMSDDATEDNSSSDEEDDDDDDDDDDIDNEEGSGSDDRSNEENNRASLTKVPSHPTSARATPSSLATPNSLSSERAAALALLESSIGGRIGSSAVASVDSTDEVETLREQLTAAKETIVQLENQCHEAERRTVAAMDDQARAVAEIKALQEINGQIKVEHHRAMVLLEHSAGPGAAARNHLAQQLESRMASMGGNPSAIMAAAAAHGISPAAAAAAMAQQHQHAAAAASFQHHHQQNHAHVIDLLQGQLTEAELRFHQVTESLTRQTGVLTDQHRAILELNSKLEKEKAKRRIAEMELNRLKGG
jgi:hypothetical protein